ncbi:MAG: tetratricopeptide repeat protein [Acidobacteriota bacterium]
MRKNSKIIIIAIFLIFSSFLSAEISSGNVYELQYFDLQISDSHFINSLAELNLSDLPRKELNESIVKLEKIGDTFAKDGKFDNALIVYNKIKDNARGYWQIHNKIENIERKKGSVFYSIGNFINQSLSLFHKSNSFFALTGVAFSSVYMASIFIFFIFSILFFCKYFKIFSNDALGSNNEGFSLKKIIFFSILLFWPLIFLTGWMIFPFILSGLFWSYMDRYEKQAVILMVILIFIFSFFYSFRAHLYKSIESDAYYTINEVSKGKYFSKGDYSKFDNELKVYLAYSYYENRDYNTSLDILLSTGENYKNILKLNLLGNIYFKSGNYEESMKYFKNTLELNEDNDTALHNFTLVLAMQKNSKVFDSYASRFPEIKNLRDKIHKIKEVRVKAGLLKKRAMNSSKEKFSPFTFIISVLKEFIELPVLYFSLLLLLYIYFINFLFPFLGESTRCSKCSKIIKKSATDASNNYCGECYQLFMIKDVIFLEAKVAKEEKIRKKNFGRGVLIGLLSLVFPGINLAFKEKYYSFIFLLLAFYSFAFFTFAGKTLFLNIFSTYPILFKISMIFTAGIYLFINLYSIRGDSDGF